MKYWLQARIAKLLNAERAPAPRPQRARPAGWAPTSVREVLFRPLYRGEIVWNQTRKRDRWGRHQQSARAGGDWVRVDAPDLRIIPEPLWLAVQARLAGIKSDLVAASSGRIGQRSRDVESHYLLPGLARCGVCGGAMCVMSRAQGGSRAFVYGCMAHHKRGRVVCGNGTVVAMDRVDAAILGKLGGDILRAEIVDAVLDGVFAELAADAPPKDAQRLRSELAEVDKETARLADAIAGGGRLDALLTALQGRQKRRDDLERLLVAAVEPPAPRGNRRDLERRVRRKLADWRSLLTRARPRRPTTPAGDP